MKPMRVLPALVPVTLLGLALAGPVGAQGTPGASPAAGSGGAAAPRAEPLKPIDVTSPGPQAAPGRFRIERTMPYEQPGAREQEFYPGFEIKSRHEPAFIEPMVTRVRTGPTSSARIGLSGWTAPAVPFDIPQSTGGLAFGLTVSWGEPAVEPKQPPAGQ